MKKEIKPIDGFHALDFKKKMQDQVQTELAGQSTEERLQRIRKGLRSGPLSKWWKKLLETQTVSSK
jgi:hypothetical protein